MTNIFKLITTALLAATLISGCSTSEAVSDQSNSSTSEKSRPGAPSDSSEIKPFSEIIKSDFVKDEGLFNVYKDDSNYFYEIPDSLLGRELLMVSRLARTADGLLYGGMKHNTQVVRWEKRDAKILMRRVSFSNTASDTLPIFEAVRNSNFEPIIATFDVKAISEDSTGSVIDITSLFTTDIPALGLPQRFRTQ